MQIYSLSIAHPWSENDFQILKFILPQHRKKIMHYISGSNKKLSLITNINIRSISEYDIQKFFANPN